MTEQTNYPSQRRTVKSDDNKKQERGLKQVKLGASSNPRAEIHLIQNTGIGNNQYMYWESKQACDEWFMNKAKLSFEDYSRVYGEERSMNKRNVRSVNLRVSLDDTQNCDYVSYYNSDANRIFHAAVVGREFVSAGATRIYFAIDYVATYWDLIKFKECFIERITGEYPVYANVLTEPISPVVLEMPAPNSNAPSFDLNLSSVNAEFKDLGYLVVSDIEKDSGDINNPQANIYGGYPFGGYVYQCPTLAEVKAVLANTVSLSSNFINKSMSAISSVQTILGAPAKATQVGDPQSAGITIKCPATGKWNKTKNYQWAIVVSGTGERLKLDPKNFGTASISANAYWYGGLDGCVRIQLNMGANSVGIGINSPTWGTVGFGGTFSVVQSPIPTHGYAAQLKGAVATGWKAST